MMPQLDVEWILPDGRVGGRTPDGTFKVHGPLVGERIQPTAGKPRGRTLEISAYDSLSPSPHRVEHACPVQAACGGCDLGALDPTVRAQQLAAMVQRALQLDAPPALVPSPRASRHRARIRLSIDGQTLGYRGARSHALVPVGDCLAARDEVAARIAEVRDALPLPGATAVEIRSDGVRAVLAFDGKIPRGALDRLDDVAVEGRAVRGDPTLVLPGAVPMRASPRSFYQVNLEANALLVAHVVALVEAVAPERVLDLYAGIGNLSLPLAARGTPVAAVELEGQAVADLRHNAQGLPVEVIGVDAGRFDPSRTPFDVVVLDPPRAGAPGVVDRLLLQRPRRIVLVSCHVPSAARDIAPLLRAGYRLGPVTAFDLFPDTHHVETVLALDRP